LNEMNEAGIKDSSRSSAGKSKAAQTAASAAPSERVRGSLKNLLHDFA